MLRAWIVDENNNQIELVGIKEVTINHDQGQRIIFSHSLGVIDTKNFKFIESDN